MLQLEYQRSRARLQRPELPDLHRLFELQPAAAQPFNPAKRQDYRARPSPSRQL